MATTSVARRGVAVACAHAAAPTNGTRSATETARVTRDRASGFIIPQSCSPARRKASREPPPLDYCTAIAAFPPRSTYFWIFPVAVFGSSDTTVIPFGALKPASRSRANWRSSS